LVGVPEKPFLIGERDEVQIVHTELDDIPGNERLSLGLLPLSISLELGIATVYFPLDWR
jgi:hypothetical protein